MKQGGEKQPALFLQAAEAMKKLLRRNDLKPAERIELRVKIAQAYLDADRDKEAEAAVNALVKDAPRRGYPLRAVLMESRQRWFEAAASWRRAALEHGEKSAERWEARLREVHCFHRAGKNEEARRTLTRYLAGGRPGDKGAEWDRVRARLAELERSLPPVPEEKKGAKETKPEEEEGKGDEPGKG